jgi:4-carboxymuconolactone decarboxylase
VEAIITNRPTSFADAREQAVYEVALALTERRIVPNGLYDRAVATLGHVSITDVIVLMGYYTAVSLTMNFYAVPAGTTGITR